ncbi:hypothetical protein GOAMI_52_00320 [Gordonia amicalis NBRC 100051 = JCM 11271]|nr:hypothetical protein GOAMI_52_00320 [Gordonia amicalis NBRC 100051 = JCM 11271]
MKTLLNVIWLLLCGLWMAIGYVVAGIICCILIITIPFGIASFRMATTHSGRSAAPSSANPPPARVR